MQVGGKQVCITRNAETLLRRLRHPHCPRRIWIDGICINQDDPDERAHQVSLMHSIFSHASTVLIWVGESDSHTDAVLRFFTLVDQRRLNSHHQEEQQPKEQPKEQPKAKYDDLIEHERDNFSRIRAFADRPWFHRAWTFQEACLSPDSQLLCGHHKLPWRIFVSATLWLTSSGMSSVFGDTADTIAALAHFAAANPSHQPAHLSTVLPLTRNLRATDPRDKVFSFLGMVDRTDLPPLIPSYTLSVAEVYTRTARAMITQERGLSALSGVYGPHRSSDRNLPSWVPDWRLPRATAYLHGFDWPSPTHLYHINNGAPFANSVHISSDAGSDDPSILKLTGAQIDVVESICNPKALLAHVAKLPLQGPVPPSSKTLEDWRVGLEKTVDKTAKTLRLRGRHMPYHQTEEDYARALMRTLTADRGGVGEKGMGDWRMDLGHDSLVTPTCRWWSGGLRGGEEESRETNTLLSMKRLASAMWTFLTARTVFATKGGLIGIAGEGIKVRDEVWDIVGGEVPFVLRRTNAKRQGKETEQRVVIGEAYVHGIMKGGLWAADLEKNAASESESSTWRSSLTPREKTAGKDLNFKDVELI